MKDLTVEEKEIVLTYCAPGDQKLVKSVLYGKQKPPTNVQKFETTPAKKTKVQDDTRMVEEEVKIDDPEQSEHSSVESEDENAHKSDNDMDYTNEGAENDGNNERQRPHATAVANRMQRNAPIQVNMSIAMNSDCVSLHKLYIENSKTLLKYTTDSKELNKLSVLILSGKYIQDQIRDARSKGNLYIQVYDFVMNIDERPNMIPKGCLTRARFYAILHRFSDEHSALDLPDSPLISKVVFDNLEAHPLKKMRKLFGTGFQYQLKLQEELEKENMATPEIAAMAAGAIILDYLADRHENNPSSKRRDEVRQVDLEGYFTEGLYADGQTLCGMFRNIGDIRCEKINSVEAVETIIRLLRAVTIDDTRTGTKNIIAKCARDVVKNNVEAALKNIGSKPSGSKLSINGSDRLASDFNFNFTKFQYSLKFQCYSYSLIHRTIANCNMNVTNRTTIVFRWSHADM